MPVFYLKAFFGFLIAFLILDAAWINLVVMPMYQGEIGEMVRQPPNATAGMVFYCFYSLVTLALSRNALQADTLAPSILNGALIGGATYGTYAITNFAVLEGWTLKLVFSDIAWGVFITSVSVLSARIASRIGRH